MLRDGFKISLSRFWAIFRSLGERRITLILSFVVGLLSGVAGVALKNTLHGVRNFVNGLVPMDTASLLYFGLPAIGILLTLLFVRYLIKDDLSHGVTKVLYSIS
ncbi:MAG TPA: chloride channel protein, partial [Tenuifilum sp.]|nr:chloride channel protein [Tenuifilum sp.]